MMNQQPDKIFREKLQHFQAPVPSGAWNRIEANLDKKNNKVLWFRIAASLLLLAIAAYILWPANFSEVNKTPLAEKKQKEIIPAPEVKHPAVESRPSKENPIAKKSIDVPKGIDKKETTKEKLNKTTKEKLNNSEIGKEEILLADNAASPDNATVIVEQETIPPIEETQPVIAASAESEKVKIIFSAAEVNDKYLDKKALAEATSDEKKSSTLKKLLDKAYDLKYNQDPFGDLRQKKNEILALNFKTDKQRK